MTTLKRMLPLIIAIVALLLVFRIFVPTFLDSGNLLDLAQQISINAILAFGMTLGGGFGKLALSIFRIIAVFLIGWYLMFLTRAQANRGLIFSVSLVFVGALGNIIDSVFYSMIFSQSTFHSIAEYMPEAGGYGGILHGKVVDMFYFPLFYGTYPEWVPIKGGDIFIFFRPVFNIADSAITTGVIILIVFQRKFFKKNITG